MTELEAVNIILRAAREYPVASLTESPANDTLIARQVLHESVGRELLSGWRFNRSIMEFEPNDDGEIIIPPDVLAVRRVPIRPGEPVEVRSVSDIRKLWNIEDNSFEWTSNQHLEVVRRVAFGDIPEYIQWAITDLAAQQYELSVHGSPQVQQHLLARAARSLARAKAADARVSDYNVFFSESQGPARGRQFVRRRWF